MDRFKIEQLIEVDVFNKISGKTRKIRGLANQLNLQGFYPAIEHYGRNSDGSLFLKDMCTSCTTTLRTRVRILSST
jgi:hypothetical protein